MLTEATFAVNVAVEALAPTDTLAGTVTELVTRAEAAGLVHRTQSEQDARVYWLELTPVGNERLARAVSRNGPERRRLLDLLSEAA